MPEPTATGSTEFRVALQGFTVAVGSFSASAISSGSLLRADLNAVIHRRCIDMESAHARLIANLTPAQRETMTFGGYFDVVSNRGRRWRIRTADFIGNVCLMSANADYHIATYCAHGLGVDFWDHYLLQKLALETDEDYFTSIANIQYIRPGITEHVPDRRADIRAPGFYLRGGR